MQFSLLRSSCRSWQNKNEQAWLLACSPRPKRHGGDASIQPRCPLSPQNIAQSCHHARVQLQQKRKIGAQMQVRGKRHHATSSCQFGGSLLGAIPHCHRLPGPAPRLACWPGWESACMRVLIVSTGYMATCSPMPAAAPAIMCCNRQAGRCTLGRTDGRRCCCLQRLLQPSTDGAMLYNVPTGKEQHNTSQTFGFVKLLAAARVPAAAPN